MRHLKFTAFAVQDRPVLAPVELEGFARLKDQRHKGSAPRRLLFTLPIRPPCTCKGGHTTVGSAVTQPDQILMQLLRRPPFLTRLPGLGRKPARQLRRIGIEFAGPLGNSELRLYRARPQILPNGVARQLRPPRDLPNGQMLTQRPTPNNAQKCSKMLKNAMSITPLSPAACSHGDRVT